VHRGRDSWLTIPAIRSVGTEKHIHPHENDRPWIAILAGAAGGAVAIAAMEFLAEWTAVPLAFIPFATSIVMIMGSPEVKPAQPRTLVGGHLVSAAVVTIAGPQPWAAAVAVGIAMIVMHVTDTFRPPAGINPLLIVLNDRSWSFLNVPVGAGVVIPVGFAYLRHNVTRRGAWPVRWR
jgi:CBS-domain-containing membrane protein